MSSHGRRFRLVGWGMVPLLITLAGCSDRVVVPARGPELVGPPRARWVERRREAVWVDARAWADATTESRASYGVLSRASVVGSECSSSQLMTEEWQALSQLVRDRELGLLGQVASGATTPEGRVLGVIGLFKLGALSRQDAGAQLADLNATVVTCGGCIFITDVPTQDMVGDLDAPTVDERELGIDRRPIGLELPGAPRFGSQ